MCKIMDTEKIKKIIEELLRTMGIPEFEVVISPQGGENPKFLITTPHSGLLIGNGGEHLEAFVYLVRKIVVNGSADKTASPKFFIDVNNYQEENLSHIKDKALVIAERVRSFKTSIEMEPMTSYERMIVHSLFTDTKDIKTESAGLGRDRRVVIKYTEKGAGPAI